MFFYFLFFLLFFLSFFLVVFVGGSKTDFFWASIKLRFLLTFLFKKKIVGPSLGGRGEMWTYSHICQQSLKLARLGSTATLLVLASGSGQTLPGSRKKLMVSHM